MRFLKRPNLGGLKAFNHISKWQALVCTGFSYCIRVLWLMRTNLLGEELPMRKCVRKTDRINIHQRELL